MQKPGVKSVNPSASTTDADVTRDELHFRRIDIRGFRRSDGLFEVEGRVVDRKPHDHEPILGQPVPAGAHMRDMGVRLVFDDDMVVHDVQTQGRADHLDATSQPTKIDSCYAYAAEGELVRRRWPTFHRPAPPKE